MNEQDFIKSITSLEQTGNVDVGSDYVSVEWKITTSNGKEYFVNETSSIGDVDYITDLLFEEIEEQEKV